MALNTRFAICMEDNCVHLESIFLLFVYTLISFSFFNIHAMEIFLAFFERHNEFFLLYYSVFQIKIKFTSFTILLFLINFSNIHLIFYKIMLHWIYKTKEIDKINARYMELKRKNIGKY